MRTLQRVAAPATHEKRREAAAVQKEDDLAAVVDRVLHRDAQPRGEQNAGLVRHVDQLDRRQRESADALRQPVIDAINGFMEWFVETFRWLFGAISWLLGWPMTGLQALLQWLPWSATLAGFTVLAYVAGGRRLAIFTALALFYMVVTGYWSESMNTLSLVALSVPLSVLIGLLAGIAAYKSRRIEVTQG